jgi:cytochrome c
MVRLLVIAFALMLGPVGALASEPATPEEVITKVKEAAAYLEKNGKSGLKTFDSAESPFVWKDTYVFVHECAAGLVNVAHPVPQTKPQKATAEKDATGDVIGPAQCEAAARPGGSWHEYMWWKPVKVEDGNQLTYAKNPSRKVAYMLSVRGQPYQVGAGIYNDTLTVDELNALLKD